MDFELRSRDPCWGCLSEHCSFVYAIYMQAMDVQVPWSRDPRRGPPRRDEVDKSGEPVRHFCSWQQPRKLFLEHLSKLQAEVHRPNRRRPRPWSCSCQRQCWVEPSLGSVLSPSGCTPSSESSRQRLMQLIFTWSCGAVFRRVHPDQGFAIGPSNERHAHAGL